MKWCTGMSGALIIATTIDASPGGGLKSLLQCQRLASSRCCLVAAGLVVSRVNIPRRHGRGHMTHLVTVTPNTDG
ncbi:hypothetical protein H4582DRAFT_1986218 [Lactarius indigo]|nr:hypothetical protein H4582DRAFT_1986218 [Lactarius indigo]